LHGAWTDSGQWQSLLPLLATHYHCLAPDLLGFGESCRLKSTAYSIALEVDCLAALLRSLRITSACFIGHSLGAWIAARYALTYPDQVSSLVLLEPEGLPVLPGRWRRYRRWSHPIMGLGLSIARPVARLINPAGWRQTYQFHQQLRHHQAACRLLFRRRSTALKAEQIMAGALSLPLWLVQGEQASAISQALSQAYLDQMPAAQLLTTTGGDDLPESAPTVLAQVLSKLPLTGKPFRAQPG
jgi:pimeloyl-ACP methyl ester carboxylesterase